MQMIQDGEEEVTRADVGNRECDWKPSDQRWALQTGGLSLVKEEEKQQR